MKKIFLHDDPEWESLLRIVSNEQDIPVPLIEKDYWIMHVLYSISESGFSFSMKGGTSLSKGFKIIDRFSEDIDLLIKDKEFESRNSQENKTEKAIIKRKNFFENIKDKLNVPGSLGKELNYGDDSFRNAEIPITYPTHFQVSGIKEHILLEIGFDDVEPARRITISSWVFDYISSQGKAEDFIDNRANDVNCYLPQYTFVEKLQAISTKFRQMIAGVEIKNFARHYYDMYKLINTTDVQTFIGSEEYKIHKLKRFRKDDESDLSKNEAFILSNPTHRKEVEERYKNTEALYYRDYPSLDDILASIKLFLPKL
ncbi:nucleotidyl transferase AbiEii/AbiGii toxin family protein [Leptospira bandrabouensis]|uniref:Nucleotidyl transferase AbiEii/AbiGii toxin family protein n=1 Tax=Leptospira bandrabouensis TaxID=2484903 RepID=A0A6H3NMU3_9LEPT|nr:nucleotidyl transferase AbiEii/AbiGii toxin family protein [Leptospira bandrabouensis]TGN11614.1 nucleotidyl transferase AbiEii/AbiGii toxin family protein [Leptospira bandrabouensis]